MQDVDATVAQIIPKSKDKLCYMSIWLPLILGQVLAVLIAITAICSTLLVNVNVNLPIFQNLPHYLALFIVYSITFLITKLIQTRKAQNRLYGTTFKPSEDANEFVRSKGCLKSFVIRLVLHFLIAFIDVHANWSIVSAYRYTNVTSVQLLDCLTIPTAVLLSYIFLHHKYRWNHYLAIILCVVGSSGMVAVDYFMSPATTNANKTSSGYILLGDFLVIVGAVGYAISNLLQQYLVNKYGFVNFMASMSCFTVLFILIYTFIFEWNQIWDVFTNETSDMKWIIIYFVGYSFSMFLLYNLLPYVLSRTNVVLVNLSLLTADIYAILVGIFLFKLKFHYLYIIFFCVIMVGVSLFTLKPPVSNKR